MNQARAVKRPLSADRSRGRGTTAVSRAAPDPEAAFCTPVVDPLNKYEDESNNKEQKRWR